MIIGGDLKVYCCKSDDKDVDCNIDFTKCSVTEAFTTLMNKIVHCMSVLQSDLGIARAACISVITDDIFKDSLRRVQSFNSLVELLAGNPMYCNWMDIRLLEVIVISSQNKYLVSLIEDFKESVYSRTLKQVFKEIPSLQKNFSKYKDLIPISQFNDPDNIKVKELLTISRHLPIEVLAPHVSVG